MNLTKLYVLDVAANAPLHFTHFEEVVQALIKDATSYMIDNWDQEDYDHIVDWSNTITSLNNLPDDRDDFLWQYLENMGYTLNIVYGSKPIDLTSKEELEKTKTALNKMVEFNSTNCTCDADFHGHNKCKKCKFSKVCDSLVYDNSKFDWLSWAYETE